MGTIYVYVVYMGFGKKPEVRMILHSVSCLAPRVSKS